MGDSLSIGQTTENDYKSAGGNLTMAFCYPGSLMKRDRHRPQSARSARGKARLPSSGPLQGSGTRNQCRRRRRGVRGRIRDRGINVTTQIISNLSSIGGRSISSIPSGFVVERVYSCAGPNGDNMMVVEGHR